MAQKKKVGSNSLLQPLTTAIAKKKKKIAYNIGYKQNKMGKRVNFLPLNLDSIPRTMEQSTDSH